MKNKKQGTLEYVNKKDSFFFPPCFAVIIRI